ncbi:MAG: ThuA domain-containing protein [Kiritimatiellales bacterium]|nr:ThuA domain-containing protein [Kiritimatiellales bacterium]
MKKIIAVLVLGLVMGAAAREYVTAPPEASEIVPPTPEWIAKVTKLAPAKPTVKPKKKRRILMFSVTTGFNHLVIPHTAEAIKAIGKKTGAYEVTETSDIEMFMPDNLEQFDAVVLNNTCSIGPGRNIFLDILNNKSKQDKTLGLKYNKLTEADREARAAELEQSLLAFVRGGKGLIVMHGGIVFLNNSAEFSGMVGGSFDFHPKRQMVTLDPVDPDHPLVAGFNGKGFIHSDEPYLFKNAYAKKNFRPLLVMAVDKLNPKTFKKPGVKDDVRYVAWIKKYGQGRVFYCSPSHQPESFETREMLRFVLDGTQYALGDLKCDDSPIGK